MFSTCSRGPKHGDGVGIDSQMQELSAKETPSEGPKKIFSVVLKRLLCTLSRPSGSRDFSQQENTSSAKVKVSMGHTLET